MVSSQNQRQLNKGEVLYEGLPFNTFFRADDSKGRPFFCFKRIFVICSGTREDLYQGPFDLNDDKSDSDSPTTVKDRTEKADMWCARFFAWGEETKHLKLEREHDRETAPRSATGTDCIGARQSIWALNSQDPMRQACQP